MQAQKFAGTEYEEEIRKAENPAKVKRMGNTRSRPLRSDWEQVKEQIMIEALTAKFTQHKDLKEVRSKLIIFFLFSFFLFCHELSFLCFVLLFIVMVFNSFNNVANIFLNFNAHKLMKRKNKLKEKRFYIKLFTHFPSNFFYLL